MANVKISGLTEVTDIQATDLVEIVRDPSGTPLSRSVKLSVTNPNILINSNGADPIDQRGSLPVTGADSGSYYVDRCQVGHNGTTEQIDIASQAGGGLRYTVTTVGDATYLQIYQQTEAFEQFQGKTLTLSASIKSNDSAFIRLGDGVTNTDSSTHTGGGAFETLTVTKTISGSATNTIAYMQINSPSSTSYLEVEWIKLEEGSVATPWTVPDPAVELARCQRYYRTVGIGASGTFTSATACQLTADWSGNPMRTTPNLSLLTTTPSIREVGVSARTGSGSTLAASNSTAYGIEYAQIDGFSSATVGGNAVGTTDKILAADAEL